MKNTKEIIIINHERLKSITNGELEKCKLTFSRCANCDVAPLIIGCVLLGATIINMS